MEEEILFVDFNQDHSCVACGTTRGFSIWNTKPLDKRIQRNLKQPIRIVRPLHKTNVIVLVGCAPDGAWTSKSLHIWDDADAKILITLTYDAPIVSVAISRSLLLVATRRHVYIYTQPMTRSPETNEPNEFITHDNSYTTIALSHDSQYDPVAVFLGINQGYVHVSEQGEQPKRIIRAHDNEIAALAISSDGKQLATASTKGTVIRVWNLINGDLDFEFRRGTSAAYVSCLAFSTDNRWLVGCSGRGTAHVFDIREKPEPVTVHLQQSSTQQSFMEYLTSLLPVWSFAQCRFPGTESVVRTGMDDQYNVFVVTEHTGDYYWFRINPICGGEASLKLHSTLSE